MKIGIDARMMSPNFGIGRYIQELLKSIAQKTPAERQNLEFIIFVKTKEQMAVAEELKLGKVVRANIHWYTIKEQLRFSKIITKEKIDLMHFPHWNVPLNYHGQFILTIHDLIMYHFPRPEATTLGPIKFWFKNKFHRMVVQSAADRALKIITPTEFTRQDVAKTLKVPVEKIMVINLAPAPNTTNQITTTNSAENKPAILDKFKINKPYLLYVGSAYPHKNLPMLITAWKIFNQKYSSDFELVLAGKFDSFYKKLSQQKNNPTNLIFTDVLTDNELAQIYNQARAFVFPSSYEGFGLPPLEAMASGVPVISSNTSCLPEVLKSAAEFFDPENSELIATAINKILTDETARQKLILAGYNLLKTYSWPETAEQTLAIYHSFSYAI